MMVGLHSEKRRYILAILILYFLIKIVYVFLGHFHALEKHQPSPLYALRQVYTLFNTNDSGWYRNVAENGYPQIAPEKQQEWAKSQNEFNQSVYAFFPLLPALIAGGMALTGEASDAVGFWLMLLVSMTTAWLMFETALWWWKDLRKAFVSTLLILLLPFHYYFSMVYTESLFLGLMLACFWAVRSGKWFWLAVFGAGLVLVRPNGLIVVGALGIFYLEQTLSFSASWKENIWQKSHLLYGLIFGAILAVFAGYCYYLYTHTGDWFAFQTAQSGWNKKSTMPWDVLTDPSCIPDWWRLVEAYYTVGVVLFSAWITIDRKLPLSMLFLIWAVIYLPLSAGSVVSMPRYISVLFPLFLLMGGWLASKPRWAIALFLVMAFGIQARLFTYWMDGHPFSY